MCPHHIITDFIVRPHALEVEGTCVSTPYHTSFIVRPHAFEVDGTCLPTPYHYNLHCSPTCFRSRGNLCVHIISLQPSLFAHMLKKYREPVCPHHIITAFIVHAHTLEVEGTSVPTSYHYSLHCSPTRFRSRGNLCVHTVSLQPSFFAHML